MDRSCLKVIYDTPTVIKHCKSCDNNVKIEIFRLVKDTNYLVTARNACSRRSSIVWSGLSRVSLEKISEFSFSGRVSRPKSDASFRGRFNDSSSSVARRTTHTHTHTHTHTDIQQAEIIRLCGRSSPETRSHVPNKAARRCAASSGIKGCGSTVLRSTVYTTLS